MIGGGPYRRRDSLARSSISLARRNWRQGSANDSSNSRRVTPVAVGLEKARSSSAEKPRALLRPSRPNQTWPEATPQVRGSSTSNTALRTSRRRAADKVLACHMRSSSADLNKAIALNHATRSCASPNRPLRKSRVFRSITRPTACQRGSSSTSVTARQACAALARTSNQPRSHPAKALSRVLSGVSFGGAGLSTCLR